MLPAMFVVSEEAAVAIRAAYEQEGELSAAIEVRRLFPGITDNARARECARTIAGWKPLPSAACQIPRLRLRRSRARLRTQSAHQIMTAAKATEDAKLRDNLS
jgi:hypothetical protein